MGLRFVIGPPGSGKTTWCAASVRRAALESPDGPPLILLVPEQASYQTEQLLLSGELAGTVRARVFSFQRLAQWVWSVGPGPQRPHLTDLHRRVLVTAILAKLRAGGRDLALTKIRSIDRGVADMVSELKSFRVTPRSLLELSERFAKSDANLSRKLSEIAAVATEYDARVSGRFMDPESSLASLREAVAGLAELQGARVFVDGFHGFTPVELEVLRGLLERAAELTVTLTMEPSRFAELRAGTEPDEWSRSLPTEETAMELLALAADGGTAVEEVTTLPVAPEETRFRREALRFACAEFRADDRSRALADAEGIGFVECGSMREEVRVAAETLLAWRTKGWRWGDMAVVTRSLDTYALEVEKHFAALGIPCFVDRHEALETHPAIQGTIAAVEAALLGLATERILDFASSRLFDFPADDVARLQEFVGEFPRRAREWTGDDPWPQPPSRSAFGDPAGSENRHESAEGDAVDRTRRAVVAPLKELESALERTRRDDGWTMRDFILPVCDLLRRAMPEPSDGDAKVLKQTGALFEAMIAASGDEVFGRDVLLDLLRETLSELQLPRIPPRVDRVIVGQADRTRFPNVRGSVVLGLAEGEFPPAGSNSSLLTDREREALEAAAGRTVRFRPSSRRLFQREAFHAWMAFTRASEEMVLTRRLSSGGDALGASPWWDELLRLFPGASVRRDAETAEREKVVRAREAAAVVCREVFGTERRGAVPPPVPWEKVLSRLSADQRGEFLTVVRAAGLRNQARLEPELARRFTPEEFRTSASAVQTHRQCPFQYFMSRMIGPRIAVAPRISPADVGNLAHATIKELTDRFIGRGQAFCDVGDAELRAEVVECFQAPLDRLAAAGLFESASAGNMALMIREHVCGVAAYLAALQRRIGGRPKFAEAGFGSPDGICRVETQVEGPGGPVTVRLRGQIDHVTAGTDADGNEWLFVIDFKLTQRRQNWAMAADGSNLQLPVYLFALSHLPDARSTKLGGAFFLQVVSKEEEPRRLYGIAPVRATAAFDLGEGGDGEKFLHFGSKPHEKTATQGEVVSDRQFDALLEKTEESIRQRVREILSGNIEVRPAIAGKTTPCSWCDYRKACRLDYSMNSRRLIAATRRADAIESWLGPAQ